MITPSSDLLASIWAVLRCECQISIVQEQGSSREYPGEPQCIVRWQIAAVSRIQDRFLRLREYLLGNWTKVPYRRLQFGTIL
jgi:hypothetical protein